MRRLLISRLLVALSLGMFVVGVASGASAVAGGQPASGTASPGNSANSSASANGVANRSGGLRTATTTATTWGPQPLSNADNNPGGANNGGDPGAYGSTRDGSPSANGNGGGQRTGQPCAGCVGKADNKNPPGQAPNGTDHNHGYECDANHGIGQTNPAHTGCKTVSPTTSTPPTTAAPATTTSTTTTSISGLTQTTLAGSAGAQVLGETLTRSGSSPTPSGTLPQTGSNVLRVAALALWLMVAGGLLLLGRTMRPRTLTEAVAVDPDALEAH